MGRKRAPVKPEPKPRGRPRAARKPLPAGLRRSLAEALVAARQARGLSTFQLAARTSLGHGTINRIEIGDASPSLENVVALAHGLGLSAAELLAGCPEWTRRPK